jgi:peptidase M28-like protein
MPRFHLVLAVIIAIASVEAAGVVAQQDAAPADAPPTQAPDPVRLLVDRLDLAKYKATIKGLTRFGDRLQGTDRNRAAVDWIESQLESFGCTNTGRIRYEYQPPATPRRRPARAPREGEGGSVMFGNRVPTSVNRDPAKQPDPGLRELNAQPTTPGPREEVFCTKVGVVHPDEMYIVAAHMDGYGFGEAANDDGSGTALVMELARILNSPDVRTDRSIRFALWNNEETGLDGAAAYVAQRRALQGQEQPAGSGKYPEPRWLGIIQHDMMLFDHGMPSPDGKVSPNQRPEADVNIEFRSTAKMAGEAQKLAWTLKTANESYAADYPASVGPHMTNTDSEPFMNDVAAVSVRENERGAQIGAGWDPHWHQPSDLFTTFSDQDFRLGLNAAQTTLGAVGRLAGATLVK